LYESDTAALATLGTVWRRVGELASLEPQFVPYLEARDDIKARLDDLARFLRQYADHIDASPDRLHGVQERLALLERLKRKYGPTLEDVIEKRAALRRQLEGLENVDDRLARLEQDCASAREAFLLVARKLSGTRRTLADSFARQLERALAGVAMDRARFEVRFSDVAEEGWSASGIDQIEFYVSANPGEDLRPLAAIVSGGELSRVMLAMKSLTVETRADSAEPGAPALIFDEVDAGIGGRVADVVGQKLRSLGSAFQVLCITHLPQIAACADAHFLIDKRVADGRTHTSITRLDDTQRVDEIGRMLAGTTITDAVRASARELLTKGNRKGLRNSRAGESERAKAKVARRTL
jgi:DNA repair protein RecN (Recombination protein N)